MAVFRLPLRWYLAAFAVPLVIPVSVTAVAVASGLPLAFGHLPGMLPGYLVFFVIVVFLGGGQEEPGWRGYLLPRLQTRISPLAASAVVGVVWAVWHLPLFIFGFDMYADRPFELYVPQLVGLAVVFTWLYNATRGSVVFAMLMHAGVNQSQSLVPVVGELDPAVEYAAHAAVTGAWIIFGVVLVAVYGTRLGGRPLGAEATGGNLDHLAATPPSRAGERRDAAAVDREDTVESEVGGKR